MSIRPIGIIIPTRWEARESLEALGRDPRVVFKISGVGRDAAGKAAEALCAQGVSFLISAGFCGAVDPDLKVGDVIDSRLATVDRALTSPASRAAFRQSSQAIAVDMESRAIIEVGTLRGVPIRMLRAVSDTAADDLSPLLGDGEAFSPLRIALRLLNPATWPLARRLAIQSRMAGRAVARALVAFVENPQ